MSGDASPGEAVKQEKAVRPLTSRECYLQHVLGIPFAYGNDLKLLRNGDEIFPAMLEAIDHAKVSIEFLTFVYWTGDIAQKFADALSKKAAEGISVRVLLDAYGASDMDHSLVEKMESHGARVCWFRPFSTWKLWRFDNRSHRKILVCDHQIAFTGGVGIAAEWEGNANGPGEWRDTHIQVRGPAVDGLAGAFWENWLEMLPEDQPETDCQQQEQPLVGHDVVMPVKSRAQDNGSDAATLLKAALYLAKKEVMIATPYFVLDDLMLKFLCDRAQAGVHVLIMIPGSHIDKRYEWFAARESFEALMASGVDLYHYEKTMCHQKIVIIDDDLSIIGSTNFNQRSLRRDAEAMLVLAGEKRNRELRHHFEDDLQHCVRVKEAKWTHRSATQRFLESVVLPFKKQL